MQPAAGRAIGLSKDKQHLVACAYEASEHSLTEFRRTGED
jgi:hypothetical protein